MIVKIKEWLCKVKEKCNRFPLVYYIWYNKLKKELRVKILYIFYNIFISAAVFHYGIHLKPSLDLLQKVILMQLETDYKSTDLKDYFIVKPKYLNS